jgi:carboxyl-terminal processing protease
MAKHLLASVFVSLTYLTCFSMPTRAQQGASPRPMSSFDRERAQLMLQDVANDVRKHYYDPHLHDIDWNAKVQEVKAKIANETTLNMAFAHIAALLDTFNDSHTFFLPPPRPYHAEFGWHLQMIGDHCFIVRVRPNSDGEAKGLKPGDELLALNGYHPNRSNLWKMEYAFAILRPQPGFHLRVKNPDGEERQVNVASILRPIPHLTDLTNANTWQHMELGLEDEEHLLAPQFAEPSPGIAIVKFNAFFLDEGQVEKIVSRANKAGSLVIDLRGNSGGAVDSMKDLLGAMFDDEVKIGYRVIRSGTKTLIAKAGFGHSRFHGKLTVLVDSKSASASEIFARVIQLEKRGTLIGDHSAGAVMESIQYTHQVGTDMVTFYGASITEANLIMTDGSSLEHTGVVPDELVLPQAADLASGHDPALARAVELLGGKLSADEAGKLFPYRWAKLQ